jgi:cysteine desulfurase
MSSRPIYLDCHATTPVDERVMAAMIPYFTEKFGNAASISHIYGWESEAAVKQTREILAAAINATPEEIVFTSGATEANNLAIKGIAEAYFQKGQHIVTIATEHKAVLDPCEYLKNLGFNLTVLPVEKDGLIDLNQLEKALRDDTILVWLPIMKLGFYNQSLKLEKSVVNGKLFCTQTQPKLLVKYL